MARKRMRTSALDLSFGVDSDSEDRMDLDRSIRVGASNITSAGAIGSGSQKQLAAGEISRSSSVASTASSTSSLLGKRKGGDDQDARVNKKPKAAQYHPKPDTRLEDDKLVIEGEDPYHEVEVEDHEEPEEPVLPQDKPIRELYEFVIFDPRNQNEMVTLDSLELMDGVDRNFEAVGRVRAHFMSEDDGMEEEIYGDDGEEEEGDGEGRGTNKNKKGKGKGKERDMQRGGDGRQKRAEKDKEKPEKIRLSSILRYTVDYTKESEPFYIETCYAWYILMSPSESYKEFYKYFYTPRRIAQLVISRALKKPQEGYAAFLSRFVAGVDMFGRTYLEEDLFKSVDEIRAIAMDEPDLGLISSAPFVKHILRSGISSGASSSRRTFRLGNKNLPSLIKTTGNPDLSVLRPENQNSTHVTPRIAQLAQGLFREEIEVIGPPPPAVNKAQEEVRRKKMTGRLRGWAERAKLEKKIDYERKDRVDLVNDLYRAVKIDGVTYKIGDVVLMPKAAVFGDKFKVKVDMRVDHVFWYARIHYFLIGSQQVHVQWFYHSSQTIMDELADPKELFLSHVCGTESLQKVVAKVQISYFEESEQPKPDEYFCKFYYDQFSCSFEDIPRNQFKMLSECDPPNNCDSCNIRNELDRMREAIGLYKNGELNGLAFAGKCFHLEDFVAYRGGEGVCNFGYVVGVKVVGKKESGGEVVVRKVGRISNLMSITPGNVMKDERHLYLTEEKDKFAAHDLVDIIHVVCFSSLQQPECSLEEWLNLSRKHFYVRYAFPRLKVKSWKHRERLTDVNFTQCPECTKDRLRGRKRLLEFLDHMEEKPLRTLDLFGGIGAFSRGLGQGSGCLKVTHAIEIGPSAARTFRKNSPETVVYNQCANIMLRYAIKSKEGHTVEPPHQIDDGSKVPSTPRPSSIDVITAGFPCQSHSTLNMFKKADDVKSNLILTTLSYLDFYKPKYAFFENVPGFVRFSLNADRANIHGAEGEIPKGGLKLLVRALLDMNYQLRFANLQAVHYGTPQGRSRFFLIAAKPGFPLPAFPQPTHHHPKLKDQSIKYLDAYDDDETKINIDPIRSTPGVAMHPYVSIQDAIGDLPRFDWKHPKSQNQTPAKREERKRRAETIPSLECKKSEPWCGFSGRIGYLFEPRTTFQYNVRVEPTKDIQHYTKCLIPPKVSRTCAVPLRAGADYRDLPPSEHDWYMTFATGSSARHGFRKGVYGRLDPDGIFGTTVTNVDPTAKQCQVLHPSQYRMVTVRELARSQGIPDSFVFVAIGRNVVTMHRQIGNAVPIPVGHALGRELRRSLFERWKSQRDEAIVIEDDNSAIEQAARHSLPPLPPPSDDFDDDMSDIYA